MRAYRGVAQNHDTGDALAALKAQIPLGAESANLVFAFFDAAHDAQSVHAFMRAHFPDAAIAGGSSATAMFSDRGLYEDGGIGLLAIADPAGFYGAACERARADPAAAACTALFQALERSGRPNELPELIWVFLPQGCEERVIEGLRGVVGDRCVIAGGSAAPDATGLAAQLSPEGVERDGITVSVLFPSTTVSHVYRSTCRTLGPSGYVTGVDGTNGAHRITEIDHEPAAQVYNRWTGDAFADALACGGAIDGRAAQFPLAIDMGRESGVDHHLLVLPAAIDAEHALHVSVSVPAGASVGPAEAEGVPIPVHLRAAARIAAINLDADSAAAAVIMVGAGTIGATAEDAPSAYGRVFGGAPFLGGFTMGEQGALRGQNLHGNLMLSAIVFGAERAA